MSFNYYDELKNGNSQNWISYINKHYMELVAPIVKVFKLNKKRTEVDTFYGEVASSRQYLPPFNIRAHHFTNPYNQLLGLGSMPYLETEEEMKFVLNFENMVNIIRELKKRSVSDIFVSYSGNENPTAIKSQDFLFLKENDEIVATFNLTESNYRTTKKLVSAINGITNFSAVFSGDNDASINIINFDETRFYNATLHFYSPDATYSHISDVIEKGDLILTNKWRLYEVSQNIPTDDFGWEYATFTLSGNLRTLDEAILPSNYTKQIKEHQLGFSDKVQLKLSISEEQKIITPKQSIDIQSVPSPSLEDINFNNIYNTSENF